MADNSPLRDSYAKAMEKYSLITPEREQELAAGGRNKSDAAVAELVQSNLRLVVKIARRYGREGIDLDDLVAEGNVGLLRAARNFEQIDVRFFTYAQWWIRAEIVRAITHSRMVRIPWLKERDYYKVRLASVGETRELGDDEIAGRTGLDAEYVTDLRMMAKPSFELDKPAFIYGGVTNGELMPDDTAVSPDARAVADGLHDDIVAALGAIKKGKGARVSARFGIETGVPKTLDEVGEQFGVSGAAVWAQEREVLDRLRYHPVLKEYAGGLE